MVPCVAGTAGDRSSAGTGSAHVCTAGAGRTSFASSGRIGTAARDSDCPDASYPVRPNRNTTLGGGAAGNWPVRLPYAGRVREWILCCSMVIPPPLFMQRLGKLVLQILFQPRFIATNKHAPVDEYCRRAGNVQSRTVRLIRLNGLFCLGR